MDDENAPGAVRLYDVTTDNTRMWLDVYVSPAGELVFAGYDCGEIPKRFWGDADYEFWLRVPAENKDALLLQLLLEKYKDDTQASSHFRKWLDDHDIPCNFESWI